LTKREPMTPLLFAVITHLVLLSDLDIVTAKVHDVHVMFVKPVQDFAPLKYGDWEKAEMGVTKR
jgi:hypothetical protein